MWKQIAKNKSLVLSAVAGLVAGCVLGVLIGLAVRAAEPEAEMTGHMGIQSVLPITRMQRQVTFAKCGHVKSVTLLNEAFVGYSKEELQAFYKNCEITEFTREQVVISQRLDTCCPEHVLLRARGDGTLCVYQPDDEFYIEQLIRVLPAGLEEELDENERKKLQSGIVFNQLSDVDTYLENLDS